MKITRRIRALLRARFPRTASYSGASGQAWFAGSLERAPSMAEFFCGDGVQAGGQGRIRRSRVPARSVALSSGGAVSVLCAHRGDPDFAGDAAGRAVAVPFRIRLTKELPDTVEALMDGLKTSTTREDLRRIRKAGFTYRVTTDPETVRTFYERHYVPLVRQHFPDDGQIASLHHVLGGLEGNGELICADLDGEWVAGIFNRASKDVYAMGNLGIRDADDEVRQKRVVAALLVQSMVRAVELGRPSATLGWSLPFLGKGPVWFKAKWGCVLGTEAKVERLQIFMDLRHEPVRRSLAESPLIHFDGAELAVSAWLEPGETPLKNLVRDSGRFPGIARWYALADPETLAAAGDALAEAADRIVPVAVDPGAAEPLWLGQVLPHRD